MSYSKGLVLVVNGRFLDREIVLKNNQPVFIIADGWGINLYEKGEINPILVTCLEERFRLPRSPEDITPTWEGMREIELKVAPEVKPDRLKVFLEFLKNRGVAILLKKGNMAAKHTAGKS